MATVLVVDDEPANLGLINAALQPHFRVRVARSGAEALRAAGTAPRPDLVLLDIVMPGMDGYTVLAKLREAPATRDIPVIFVTALYADEDEQRGLDLGAVDYLSKPVRPAIALARVRLHLELKVARDALTRQNSILETRVAERTSSLQRTAEALRATEARLRNLFEQASDGIFVIGADSRFLEANERGLELLGRSRGELQRLTVAEVVGAREMPRVAAGLSRVTQSEPLLVDWDLLRKDGTTVPVEGSARQLDEHSYLAIVRNVTAHRAAEQALLRYQVELSELTQRLLQQERATTRRVAQALHDHLGQTLALARLRLGTLSLRHGRATPAEHEAALAQLGALLEQAVGQARQVLADLRPPLLEDAGLAAALDNELRSAALAQDAGGATALPQLHVTPAAQEQRWPSDAEYAAFMVAREAIANALHHAHASRIDVHLDGGPLWLQLHVDDDGIGLAPDLAQGRPGHLGIVGMRERALAIGARFAVDGRAAGGTRVTLDWEATPR